MGGRPGSGLAGSSSAGQPAGPNGTPAPASGSDREYSQGHYPCSPTTEPPLQPSLISPLPVDAATARQANVSGSPLQVADSAPGILMGLGQKRPAAPSGPAETGRRQSTASQPVSAGADIPGPWYAYILTPLGLAAALLAAGRQRGRAA
jgi:hypothetical protein